MVSVNRRELLKAGAGLVGAGALAAALPAAAHAQTPVPAYFPHGGSFTHLYTITDDELSDADGVLTGTLQGLAARGGRDVPRVYVTVPDSSTATWLADLQSRYGVTATAVHTAADLLAQYPQVRGYVLYDATDSTSLSVATTVAGLMDAVAVDVTIEDTATAAGLSLLADVRGRDDAWVMDNYWSRLRHDFAVEQKPTFPFQLRDLATMAGAMLFYDGNSAFREQLIEALDADSPVIGWGDATNGENTFVSPDSKAGDFEIAADWARNVSTLSGIRLSRLHQHGGPGTPVAEPGVHYVTFVVTDGDNAQWLLTSLADDPNWWANPQRGTVNLGWGIPPTLLDLAPSVMRWYYDNAATGQYRDQFTVGPSGSGYMYPSQYPADRLQLHTTRLNSYMARTDLSVVQILDFDALDSVSTWDAYTAQPSIAGLLYLEYSRYDAGGGQIVWSHDKPVISARNMLWDGLPGADETTVADAINAAPRDPTSPDGYTFVTVHAWSKSLDSIKSVVAQLAPDVRVVTPVDFTHLVATTVQH
jgi:putative glycoside hydrolase with GxGYxYP motif/GxGYxY motif-containing protein